MPVYDIPEAKCHPELARETTVRVAIWSIATQSVHESAAKLSIDLKNLGFVSPSPSSWRFELQTRRSIVEALELLRSLLGRAPGTANQDIWFQSSLDYFRDAAYLSDFVDYCKGTSHPHNLEVGPWGKGAKCGKASVLFKMTNVPYLTIVETLEQIRRAVGA